MVNLDLMNRIRSIIERLWELITIDDDGAALRQQVGWANDRGRRAVADHFAGGKRLSAQVTKALCMAALCATLNNPLIKAFYKKLPAKGKPAKVALTAVMRKLLIYLNSRLKTPLQTTA